MSILEQLRATTHDETPEHRAAGRGLWPSTRAWARALFIILARAYRAALVTLTVIAVVPSIFGLGSFVVRSGSMEPHISVGDVALTKHISPDSKMPLGRVFVFRNASLDDGSLLIHRVVEKLDDGMYRTAGDANAVEDAAPQPRSALTRQAILLVPYVGKPVAWFQSRQFVPLGGWLLFTIIAFVVATRRLEQSHDDDPEDTHEGGAGDGPDRPVLGPEDHPDWPAWTRTRGRAAVAAALMAVLGLVGISTTQGASAGFTGRTSNRSNTWTVKATQLPYVSSVTADNPLFFWLLDEASGPNAVDYTGNGRTGTYTGVSYGSPGALPNNPGTSIGLGGGTGRIVEGGASRGAPNTFTVELWFKTTDSGRLIAFGNTRDSSSSQFDRMVYIDSTGHLVYGAWTFPAGSSIQSPKSYTDNAWHHLAVGVTTGIFGSTARMYVDGSKVDEGPVTTPSSYTGWWRVGYGAMPIFGYPSASLDAQIDAVAVYDKELSAARIQAHYNSR